MSGLASSTRAQLIQPDGSGHRHPKESEANGGKPFVPYEAAIEYREDGESYGFKRNKIAVSHALLATQLVIFANSAADRPKQKCKCGQDEDAQAQDGKCEIAEQRDVEQLNGRDRASA